MLPHLCLSTVLASDGLKPLGLLGARLLGCMPCQVPTACMWVRVQARKGGNSEGPKAAVTF
jgi:hypothetical protein